MNVRPWMLYCKFNFGSLLGRYVAGPGVGYSKGKCWNLISFFIKYLDELKDDHRDNAPLHLVNAPVLVCVALY